VKATNLVEVAPLRKITRKEADSLEFMLVSFLGSCAYSCNNSLAVGRGKGRSPYDTEKLGDI